MDKKEQLLAKLGEIVGDHEVGCLCIACNWWRNLVDSIVTHHWHAMYIKHPDRPRVAAVTTPQLATYDEAREMVIERILSTETRDSLKDYDAIASDIREGSKPFILSMGDVLYTVYECMGADRIGCGMLQAAIAESVLDVEFGQSLTCPCPVHAGRNPCGN